MMSLGGRITACQLDGRFSQGGISTTFSTLGITPSDKTSAIRWKDECVMRDDWYP